MLDLGCGPGLYCERLYARGSRSPASTSRLGRSSTRGESAAEKGLAIEYVLADYTHLGDQLLRAEFDAALIINLDFAVLPGHARDAFLANVRRALKPGGAFAFDVPTKAVHREGAERWSVAESGFWSGAAYLELTREFEYPEASADCQQTLILTASGEVRVYRIWSRSYSVESITAALGAQGLAVESVWSDLTGQPYASESATLGVVARKA